MDSLPKRLVQPTQEEEQEFELLLDNLFKKFIPESLRTSGDEENDNLIYNISNFILPIIMEYRLYISSSLGIKYSEKSEYLDSISRNIYNSIQAIVPDIQFQDLDKLYSYIQSQVYDESMLEPPWLEDKVSHYQSFLPNFSDNFDFSNIDISEFLTDGDENDVYTFNLTIGWELFRNISENPETEEQIGVLDVL